MTPEERNLVSDLFGRLATVENSPRDPDAERVIRDGLRQAPNALYALVQTTLMQDAALKHADERIRTLEAQAAGSSQQHSGSFLGGGSQSGGRDNVWGRPGAPRAGSVPTVRPPDSGGPSPSGNPAGYAPATPAGYAPSPQPGYAQPSQPGYAPAPQPGYAPAAAAPGRGGSFLGTAATAAAGAIGGALLMNSMRSMMGGPGHAAGNFGGSAQAAPSSAAPFGSAPPGADKASPWSDASGGNLARDAGVNDIGRTPSGRSDSGTAPAQGAVGGNESAPNSDGAQYEDDVDNSDDTQYAEEEEQGNVVEPQDVADFEDDGGSGSDGGNDGGDGGDE